MCVGDFIFSLAEKGEFIVFDRMKGSVNKKMQLGGDEATFPDDFMHPNTYLNKLVFSVGPRLQLWNIIAEQKVFEFDFSEKEKGARVTCVQ